MMKTRLNSLFAGAAFTVAGIFGAPAAAMAADHTTSPATTSPATDTAVTAVVEQVANTNTSAAPSDAELHPLPITTDQKTFTPSAEQLANAKAIVDEGKAMGLPPRAWTIAVATSLQETNLKNLGDLGAQNDHDSRGLFQQRLSTGGWGTEAQIMDPHHAAHKFYERLATIDGYQTMPLTKAAQKVQVSAYPDHYAKHEQQAGDIIAALHGTGPHADAAKNIS